MRVWGMHERAQITLNAANRSVLEAVVTNRNSPQKHVWRAKIILLTADGHGTTEISGELGSRFYDEMSGVFRRILARPFGYKQFDPPARRAFTDGFPYAAIYVTRPDVVWIVAVMHVRREPNYWKGRLGT